MRISIYITSYNQRLFLGEAIESALSQTLKPDQIIIIDDYSNDGSQAIIERYGSDYSDIIAPVFHHQNSGVAQCRIEALQHVTGDLVASLDGDDRFLPTKLEKEVVALQSDLQAQIAFSNVYYIDEAGERIGQWAEDSKPPTGNVFCQTFGRDFPKRNLFRSELVYYQAWRQIGFHDLNLPNLYEDYDMRIRLTKQLHTVYCDEPLSEYRLHAAGLSRVPLARHVAALDYIYQKNKSLLNDLSTAEREQTQRKFGEWVAGIAKQASREALGENQRLRAAQLLLTARRYDRAAVDWKSFAQLVAPAGTPARTSAPHRVNPTPPKDG
jgi:glycosyltransferase involved in cell wall biosynthesis